MESWLRRLLSYDFMVKHYIRISLWHLVNVGSQNRLVEQCWNNNSHHPHRPHHPWQIEARSDFKKSG